jgi:hypothetical protein
MVPPESNEAAGDQPLMISQRMQGIGTAQSGNWVAAGAINDEGEVSITQIDDEPGDPGTIEIVATHELVGSAGSIELRSRTTLQPFPPPPPKRRVLVEGRWRLTSGTGAYANLSARGRMYATVTDVVLPGGQVTREVTLVRDGSAQFE